MSRTDAVTELGCSFLACAVVTIGSLAAFLGIAWMLATLGVGR